MDADADANREEDQYREITEADVHDDLTDQHIPDVQLDDDLREVAAAEPVAGPTCAATDGWSPA